MTASGRPRSADIGRAVLGAVLLVRPDVALRLSEARGGRRVPSIVRILGVRYLLQSAAGLAVRRPWLPAADSAVDEIHAASMVVLAVAVPRHRRLALVSATLATAFSLLDRREGRRAR